MDVFTFADGIKLVFKPFGNGGKYPRYARKRVCRQLSALLSGEKAVKLARRTALARRYSREDDVLCRAFRNRQKRAAFGIANAVTEPRKGIVGRVYKGYRAYSGRVLPYPQSEPTLAVAVIYGRDGYGIFFPARRYLSVTLSPASLRMDFSDVAPSIFVPFICVMTSPLRSPASSAGERSLSPIGRTPVITTPSVLNRIPSGVPAAMSVSRLMPETFTAEKIIIAVKKTVSLIAALFFVIFPLSGGMFFS